MKILSSIAAAPPVNLATGKGAGEAPNLNGMGPQPSFGAVLSGMLKDVDGTLRSAERLSIAALSGDAPLQKVVETVVLAEQKVQLTTAVRDKIVAAYLELTRMPI